MAPYPIYEGRTGSNRFFLIKPRMNRAVTKCPRDQHCMRAHRPETAFRHRPICPTSTRKSEVWQPLNLCFSKCLCSSSIYIYIALNCFSLVSYDSGIEIGEFDKWTFFFFPSCSAAFGCCGCSINGSCLLALEFQASG